jgi:drug/metabolite transporter (DMT)-like permease
MSPSTNRTAWFAFAIVCVVWGTTYLAIKVALESIPPFLMGGLRYVAAGAMLAGWLSWRGRALPPRADWGRIAVLGFLMLGLGNGGVVWAEQHIASGLAAVMIATSPFWMVAIDSAMPGGERLGSRQWTGLAVGFAGIVLLVWPDLQWSGAGATKVLLGVIALQIACAGWAVASAYTRRRGVASDVLGTAALQMIFGGAFMTLAGTLAGEWSALAFTWRTTSSLLYLIVFGSLIAFAAYSYALRHLPVSTVSLYTYINPVIAVALGTLLLGEPFRLSMLAAGGVIVLGILIVRQPRAGRPGERRIPGLRGYRATWLRG